MIGHQMDVARFNFSWGTLESRVEQMRFIREIAKECGRSIPIIQDLPGPRVQEDHSHTYNREAVSALTDQDKEFIRFGAEYAIEYAAVSFVGGPEDVLECRDVIRSHSGAQRIISKIERKVAVDAIDEIIAVTDAIMVARGDLGNEIPLERIPFVQQKIIEKCKAAGKPVITATQMMLSIMEQPTPTRAEVTDVANAILEGSDAVMLSEETTEGKYPVEAIVWMEKIVLEAERHLGDRSHINSL